MTKNTSVPDPTPTDNPRPSGSPAKSALNEGSEFARRMARNTARLQELGRAVGKTKSFAVYWRSLPENRAVLHTIIFGKRVDADVRAREIERACGGKGEVVEVTDDKQPPKTIA
jgi:hypothetical protein